MALDMLSILAMLAKAEHLFSGAKILITERHNHLGIELIRMLKGLDGYTGVL
jgi:hypothetical protein